MIRIPGQRPVKMSAYELSPSQLCALYPSDPLCKKPAEPSLAEKVLPPVLATVIGGTLLYLITRKGK